ncbi:hypothetical protein C0Q70_06765 [Pomacea canaliculata]|uniref:Uncharacterized protein n=1 Tax=Pomacea canaliculata TaxID=400727 RepID=A0A2T7PD53_POMCA|nr:hypothetical protein C0Q70_06765 [Pomacea canaliculata]
MSRRRVPTMERPRLLSTVVSIRTVTFVAPLPCQGALQSRELTQRLAGTVGSKTTPADRRGQPQAWKKPSTAEVRAQRRDSPDPEEPSSTIPRSKSRSRSGSRKRFSSLFRRRGRSNRSKSETDISKVERRDGARRHESADDVKGRRSEEENQVNRLRQSASLDRDAYRRYHPAKQPRDRLMHMTVKDVIIEDRRRRDVSLSTLASLRRDTALQRPGLSSSVPDVSNAPATASPTTGASPAPLWTAMSLRTR